MTSDWSLPDRTSIPQRALQALNKEKVPFLLTLTTMLAAGGTLTRMPPDVYESSSTLLLQSPLTTEQFAAEAAAGVGQLEAVGERVNPVDNQVALLKSRPVFEEALRRLNLTPEQAPYSKLAVAPVGDTDLVKVAYQAESPELAANVVRAIVEVYTEKNLESNRQQGAAARQFLEDRLPQLEARLQNARKALQQFQSQNRFLGTLEETNATTETLNSFGTQVAMARSELSGMDQKLAQLRSQLSSNPINTLNAAGVSQDPVYQQLQSQLVVAETTLEDLLTTYTAEDPHVISATENRDRIRRLLDERAERLLGGQAIEASVDPIRQRLVEEWFKLQTDRAAQAARLEQLTQQFQQLQSRSAQLPRLLERHKQLQLNVDLAEQEYRTFQQQYTASEIAEQEKISNVRIVEPAVINENPVAPNRNLLLALAIVASTATAIGVVWLRRQGNQALNATQDLKEILPLPILATVPKDGEGRLNPDLPLDEQAIAYSYRLLQAHLKMLPRQMKAIAICSWSPREGRSSVAYNLGLLEAKAGQRVLLIDAYRPPLAEWETWGVDSRPDEATHNGKTGGKSGWQSTVRRILPNLDVLPSSQVCSTANYREWMVLLEQARERYDLVILDCPPMAQGADAALLASLSDGVLWVVRPDLLGRQGVEASANNLRTWSAKLLGQVVMDVDREMPAALPDISQFLMTSGTRGERP
jgi:uncharacterized protein involved in exopolysaccharide biosynthesis/MinD-like ATPase involved in chromosome partitioning or flagellar assembly